MILISILSFCLAVFFYSVKELQAHGKLKWSNALMDFWGSESYVRKYKGKWQNDNTGYNYDFEHPSDNWYYRFFKIKYKERFPLSATLLVSITDGAHLMQTLFKILFCVSIVTYSMEFSWWIVLVYFVEWGVVFTLTYKWLSK